ncbi:hypothetical protein E3Q12_00031 [Wallemia mellicola]|uniref:COP9 signalosome complex subunit 5 n=1 Tax=Wallemia mellicola TaxID=1708541 RepID=A0AB74KP64_9BASI|nr:hypothetical protein E3Q12_00031 [Wallemia mellicola]TIC58279.1 hypothetical protein E3Q04_00218 [Wallemia mellicola]TIC72032.1 hypothetical protein E3Q03_00212 [Wallemia mellicola]
MDSSVAMKTFDLENDVEEVDLIYTYDEDAQRDINNKRPWKQDPHYFKRVKISTVALIKMVLHARSGVPYEVMGLMQGKLEGNTMIIMDAFALPVQGTETRVNASSEANEFMVNWLNGSKSVNKPENALGWYHSHPGYGCWLSGIDVTTQSTNQQFQDPWVAVVIDPNRTISAGRVDIGAFRTYPQGYMPPKSTSIDQNIPQSKIEDFGVHANAYYQLEVSIFKSSLDKKLLDLLWNKYWVNTLSQSKLITNRAYLTDQISDLQDKLKEAEMGLYGRGNAEKSDDDSGLVKALSSTSRISYQLAVMSTSENLPPNAYRLPRSNQLEGYYSDRIIRLLVEEGLNHLPTLPKQITTETGEDYDGVGFEGKVCGVSILRAGEAMESALRECLRSVRIGKVLVQRNEETGEARLYYAKLPEDIHERFVLLLDPMLATGGSAIRAIEVLLSKGVKQDKIVFLNVLSAPEGLKVMYEKYPKMKIVTGWVDRKLDERNYIVPGLGDFGDRYFA